MSLTLRATLFVSLLVVLQLACAHADPAAPPASRPVAPASQPTAPAASQPAGPFARLRVVVPKNKLPPLVSVRVRDRREAEDRSRKGNIRVSINTSPRGAVVLYGGKSLGTTPLTLSAHKGSTPLDVVIRARGYMTLRTRIRRKKSRSYFFKLTPAKIR